MENYLGRIYLFSFNYQVERGDDFLTKKHFFILIDIEFDFYYFVPITSQRKNEFATQYQIEDRPTVLNNPAFETFANCNRIIKVHISYLHRLRNTHNVLDLNDGFKVRTLAVSFYNLGWEYIDYVPL